MKLTFDNTYVRELDGFYVPCAPQPGPAPELVFFNRPLAAELGIAQELEPRPLAMAFSGHTLPEGAEPIAQAYAGHQFGQLNPQLGDGRALILGECLTQAQQRVDLCLKGSGQTPFSRGGDGKAALSPMLREVLVGEAMHALGIPTTRSLAVVASGEQVLRDGPRPGAVLTRIAASHIRIGTFQYFAIRDQYDKVMQLAQYTIARHYPHLIDAQQPALELLRAVTRQQASLVARWMSVGFIHGVMNTDNMSIAGETIDYGPCAFMDAYHPGTVFSSIDQHGRYAYGNQPGIAQWNLARFGECLLPLIDEDKEKAVALATEVINDFAAGYEQAWLESMAAKAGCNGVPGDVLRPLVEQWLEMLEQQGVDYTLAWRNLGAAVRGDVQPLRALFGETTQLDNWLALWEPCLGDDRRQIAAAMDRVNPLYIPRNHLVEEALSAAELGNMQPFEQLFPLLLQPFDQQPGAERFAQPADENFSRRFRTFCGT